jgi:hypothetical protein
MEEKLMSRTFAHIRNLCTRNITAARSAHPRAFATVAIAAILLVPVAAIALPIGGSSASYTGASSNNVIVTNIFTAQQTVVCMVTSDLTTSTQNVSFSPTGTQTMWPLAKISGNVTFSGQGSFVSPTVLGGYYTANASRAFTINAGETAQFGCRLSSNGSFANAAINGSCTVTYACM